MKIGGRESREEEKEKGRRKLFSELINVFIVASVMRNTSDRCTKEGEGEKKKGE